MKLALCWLLGHSRGPVSDTYSVEYFDNSSRCVQTRHCGCCGKPTGSFSLVRKLHLNLGQELPRGYGVAWVNWSTPTAVAMPIPINLIAGALYRLRNWMKVPHGLVDSPTEAYRHGYREGRVQGREDEIRARMRRGMHQNGPPT